MSSCNSSRTGIAILRMLLSPLASPSNPSAFLTRITSLTIVGSPAILCCQLKASALLLSFLGTCTILNLYYSSFSNYYTCLLISSLVVVNNVRFLQSKSIVRSKQLSAQILQCLRHETIASSSLSCTSQFSSAALNFLKQ